MARRTFTATEVDALIPQLEGAFTSLLQLRAGLRALENKLRRAGVEPTREAMSSDSGPRAVRQAKSFFRAYDELFTRELARVSALGGEIKDVDQGLVDFHGRRDGEDICLCWKLGERRCGFWHTPEAGFAGRRSVDELEAEVVEAGDEPSGAHAGRQ